MCERTILRSAAALAVCGAFFGCRGGPSGEISEEPTESIGAAATRARSELESTGKVGFEEPAPAAIEAVAQVGKPAPDFTLTDLDGKPTRLSELRGKPVVLEWFNPECPFVARQHGEGFLGTYPPEAMAQGVVWVAINSNAPGKQASEPAKNAETHRAWGMTYPILMDPTGAVARLYDARTTPHMFVIDERGVLVYSGAIDDDPPGAKSAADRVNYVERALSEMRTGPVSTRRTEPYGCTIR
jgi:peroxiredoxin